MLLKVKDAREPTAPSPGGAAVFRGKALLLRLKRMVHDSWLSRVPRHQRGESLVHARVIAESTTELWTSAAAADLALQAGKVHNLRVALRRLNGVEAPAGSTFSFWAQVGRPSRWKGYVDGRELREGCLIATTGGGLCQLSNALYDAALRAGFEIVERHAHTQVVPGSLAEVGRDATVFWNYVDLRFRSQEPFRIEAFLAADRLTVHFRGGGPAHHPTAAPRPEPLRHGVHAPNGCDTCGVVSCFRHAVAPDPALSFGRAAYLVDEYWPEYDRTISAQKRSRDVLGIPLDGRRFGKPNYRWNVAGFARTRESRWVAALRSMASRWLGEQGAARQRALLRFDEMLAARFASLLTCDVTHVTVTQSLLPFLWRDGHLGGRTFDVLMTRLPLVHLHRRLDAVFARNPLSHTLADFRAPSWLVAAERDALEGARRIVTPHTEIARIYPAKVTLLDWWIPSGKRHVSPGNKVIFPSPTVGRKGAYELRRVAQDLGLEIVTVGSQLEGQDFWGSVRVTARSFDGEWLQDAAAVVLPAFVEHKPRGLLEAVASGVPVIASSACGLELVKGVVTIPVGDTRALADALASEPVKKSPDARSAGRPRVPPAGASTEALQSQTGRGPRSRGKAQEQMAGPRSAEAGTRGRPASCWRLRHDFFTGSQFSACPSRPHASGPEGRNSEFPRRPTPSTRQSTGDPPWVWRNSPPGVMEVRPVSVFTMRARYAAPGKVASEVAGSGPRPRSRDMALAFTHTSRRRRGMKAQGRSRTLLVVRALVLVVVAAALVPICMVTGAAAFTLVEQIMGLAVKLEKEVAEFQGKLKVLEARMGDGSVRPSQGSSVGIVDPGPPGIGATGRRPGDPALQNPQTLPHKAGASKLSPGQASGFNPQPEPPGSPDALIQALQTSVEKMQRTTRELEKGFGTRKDQRGVAASRNVHEHLNGLEAAIIAILIGRKAGKDQQEFQRAFGEVKSQIGLLLPAVQKVREAAARPVQPMEHKGK